MSRPYKPAGLPTLIPYLVVRNAEESVAFYRDVCQFTWQQDPNKPKQEKITHAEMTMGDAWIMFAPEGEWGGIERKSPKTTGTPPSISLYLYVPDVDAHYQHAKQKGAEIIKAPEDMFWGDRCYQLRDPDGYEWCFGTNIGEHQYPETK